MKLQAVRSIHNTIFVDTRVKYKMGNSGKERLEKSLLTNAYTDAQSITPRMQMTNFFH